MTPKPPPRDDELMESNEPETPVTENYAGLAHEEPPRDVAIPPGNAPATMEDAMLSGGDLSDMQMAVKKAFPDKWSFVNLMVARIAPEVFLPLMQARVINRVMMADPTKPIDVMDIISEEYVALGIGLDGRGRIDLAEFAGAAREDRLRKLQSPLGGLPGAA